MKSLNIGAKLESFAIDGDESRVISFDPGDFNIIARADEATKNIGEYMKSAETPGEEKALSALRDINDKICEQVDYIFGEGAAKAAFNGVSPISVDSSGTTLFQRFFEAVIPVVKETVEANMKASEKRIAKYTKNAK